MNNKLLGVFIEALNDKHGREIIQFFKNNNVDTCSFQGTSNKERATEMLAEFGSDIKQIKW